MKSESWIFLGLGMFVFVGCATSPLGRQQLTLVPDSQMNEMGTQAFSDMKKKEKVSEDARLNRYVHCVIDPLLAQLDDDRNWEIVVFDEPNTVNAFALPGGKIGVYSGLFKAARTPGQLAAVVGHEIGHVIARHGNERVSTAIATQGGVAIIASTMADQNSAMFPLLMAGLGLGAQFGILMPHSRTQESESDLIGLDLMAKAGFDPAESVELWGNMQAVGGTQPPEWLSTHPSNATRIHQLQANMPGAKKSYEAARSRGDFPRCEQ